jgi:Ase1/PRC1/MAP65 family protein
MQSIIVLNCTFFAQLREMVEALFKLWKLMDTSQEERGRYAKLTSIAQSSEDAITFSGVLSQETLDQVSATMDFFYAGVIS